MGYMDFAQAALGPCGLYTSSVTSTASLLVFVLIDALILTQSLSVMAPISWQWPGGGADSGRKWWSVLLTVETLFFCFVDIGRLLGKIAIIAPIVTIAMLVLGVVGS